MNKVKTKFKNISDSYKDAKSISPYFELTYEVLGTREATCMSHMFLRSPISIKKSQRMTKMKIKKGVHCPFQKATKVKKCGKRF